MRQTTEHGRHGPGQGDRAPCARAATRHAAAPPRRPRLSGAALTAACGATLMLSAAVPASAAAGGSADRDVQLVYCLGPAHQDDLVAAAVRLGLLRPGSTTGRDGVRLPGSGERPTVQRWAEQHEKDFSRACSALMAAESDSPASAAGQDGSDGGWLLTLWQGVLLSAAGALLTLLGQTTERLSAERRELRRQLHAQEAAFRTAARAYLAAYENSPGADHTAVRTAREALAATLFRVPGPAARRRAARRVAEELPLARPLPAAHNGTVLGTSARAAEAQRAGHAVNGLPGSVADLSRSAGHWSLLGVRERHTPGTTPGAAV